MSFIQSSYTSSGFGDWGNRFPDDTNTGTENPKSNPELVARVRHLEQKVESLRETVRNCDSKLDAAKNKVSNLKDKLSSTREKARNYRAKHLELGKKKDGLEGKIAGNKAKLAALKRKLQNTTDQWARSDIQSSINERENLRWSLPDQLSNTTDAYYRATENMHSAENKVTELGYSVDSAIEAVYTCRENCNARKEQLAEHREELAARKSELNGGGW